MFPTGRERREAWETHRDRLMAEFLAPPLLPGRRPSAWWEFEAGRPQYLTENEVWRGRLTHRYPAGP